MGVGADELHRLCVPPKRFIPDQHDGRPGHGAKREQKLPACVFHCLAIHDVVMMEMCFEEALCFHLSANIAAGRGRPAPFVACTIELSLSMHDDDNEHTQTAGSHRRGADTHASGTCTAGARRHEWI